jgi:hypothetical protein
MTLLPPQNPAATLTGTFFAIKNRSATLTPTLLPPETAVATLAEAILASKNRAATLTTAFLAHRKGPVAPVPHFPIPICVKTTLKWSKSANLTG